MKVTFILKDKADEFYSGKMTALEAADYYENPDKIVGHFAKVKTMLHGVKDLPRFPTFESIRLKQDMS